MRCFIALDLPKEVKDYLFEFQRKSRTQDAKITWVAKKNLHLTLKFLGDINQEKIEKIKERLSIIASKQISARLDKLGIFPDEAQPRVFWIGITPEKEILKLAHQIDEETLDLVSSEQRFKAHLTLGRIKTLKSRKNFLEFVQKLNIEKMSFSLTSFTLYQSELTKQGPIYKIIATYSLT